MSSVVLTSMMVHGVCVIAILKGESTRCGFCSLSFILCILMARFIPMTLWFAFFAVIAVASIVAFSSCEFMYFSKRIGGTQTLLSRFTRKIATNLPSAFYCKI